MLIVVNEQFKVRLIKSCQKIYKHSSIFSIDEQSRRARKRKGGQGTEKL